MKLVFVTNNKHKLAEVQAMLPQFKIISLATIGCFEDIEESAKTLEGNAKIKADFITNQYQLPCFADDTGLEVDALNGAPGVYSARYAGTENNTEANIQKLLLEVKEKANRKAQFRTVIALNLNGKQHFFEGICKGKILLKKQGKDGFGYDAVFKPNGFDKTFAEMTSEEKNTISHRAKAIQKLIYFLKTQS